MIKRAGLFPARFFIFLLKDHVNWFCFGRHKAKKNDFNSKVTMQLTHEKAPVCSLLIFHIEFLFLNARTKQEQSIQQNVIKNLFYVIYVFNIILNNVLLYTLLRIKYFNSKRRWFFEEKKLFDIEFSYCLCIDFCSSHCCWCTILWTRCIETTRRSSASNS